MSDHRAGCRIFLTGYLVSSSSSACRAQGKSSSLHPIGKPLYPMPTMRLSWFTMLTGRTDGVDWIFPRERRFEGCDDKEHGACEEVLVTLSDG